jgi:YfiR/HmsC-like
VTPATQCALAYIGDRNGVKLDALEGRPVLTVTDEASGPGSRGIIDLVMQDNRERFQIDQAAVVACGLVIGSKQLSLVINRQAMLP